MGDVAISIKIMPTSPEVDLEKLKITISGIMEIKDTKIEPLAFGLNALKILVVKPDTGGGTEDIEKQLKELPEIETVEVEEVTLL
jgi:elongation factor 1-beta